MKDVERGKVALHFFPDQAMNLWYIYVLSFLERYRADSMAMTLILIFIHRNFRW